MLSWSLLRVSERILGEEDAYLPIQSVLAMALYNENGPFVVVGMTIYKSRAYLVWITKLLRH